MPRAAHFRVDPRLASLLGEGYRSSEEALKELVDNAWDADAENVNITLPAEVTTGPIVIEDDGTGMTDREVRDEYLVVARDRRSRVGSIRTHGKKRLIKGRKGIGKFAGLMAADDMRVDTRARGARTQLRITKADLLATRSDLEQIDLPLDVKGCAKNDHGTNITLTHLSQYLAFPSAEKLKQMLILEYGRQQDFVITVNGDAIGIEDIPGETVEERVVLPGVGEVRMKFTVSESKKPLKQSGIAIRVGGKIVGRPSTLGLDEDETIPPKLLKRVYGEIEADGLEGEVTADWGAIIENSKGFQPVKAWASERLRSKVKSTFKNDIGLQKARMEKEIKRRLAELPAARRQLAEEAIQKVLQRFYGESDERIEGVVSVMLEVFERNEYWVVVQKIHEAGHGDVARLSAALGEFGLVDLAVVAEQARQRLGVLDELDRLAADPATEEAQLHTAIATNLWVLGPEYALIASNKSLVTLLRTWMDQEFRGARAKKRPDLFLAHDAQGRYVLIEFKRPSHTLTRDDDAQAAKYRDDLAPYAQQRPIQVVMIGGKRDPRASPLYPMTELSTLARKFGDVSYAAFLSASCAPSFARRRSRSRRVNFHSNGRATAA